MGWLSVFALIATSTATAVLAATFKHEWDVPLTKQMWVDFYFIRGIEPGAPNLTETQTKFVADNYAIVSLEKCLGEPANNTIDMFNAWLPKLKAQNPDLKVIFYWHSSAQIRQCYNKPTLMWEAHPEWMPTQDNGQPVSSKSFYSNDSTAAADYWVKIATEQTAADGFFVDGASHPLWQGVSTARLNAASNATVAKFDKLRAAVGDRVVLGNTLSAYPQQPDFNMDYMPHLDGACAEHVGAFEQVLPGKNELDTTMTAGLLTRMWQTAAQMNKTVLARTWPGPVTTPIDGLGPTWHVNPPSTPTGRAAAAAEWVDWALALYLTVATEYTYWSYNWWYNADSGVYPCASGECEAPSEWYPVVKQSPGAPLGPALRWTADNVLIGEIGSIEDLAETASAIASGRMAAGIYKRSFEHVNVAVDLGTMSANLTWV